MKKYVIVIMLFMVCLSSNSVSASHTSFQELEIYEGKLISDFTDSEYEEYYSKVSSRKFIGWNTYYVTTKASCRFIAETLFSYYNAGTSSISYTYSSTLNNSTTMSLSATGSISYSISGNIKTFKNGLDTTLKITGEYKTTEDEKETVTMKFECDPGTKVTMYTTGEGYLYNGVARRYFFWISMEKGAFEYFVMSTKYQRLEKVKI